MAINDQDVNQSAEVLMMKYLDKEEGVEEETPEELPEEEPEEPEQDEEEDSEEEQPSATVKLKVNGEEVDKPLEEVVSLAQQGLDYTQKTQKLADERREVENYAQSVAAQEQRFQQQVQLQQIMSKMMVL